MSDIAKVYDPKQVEPRWYSAWTEAGCFRARPREDRPAFCVMIPPPNVTGVLTMGHVLNNTIQDILVRRARLEGREALWLPGTDHASIATHARIEKRLKEEGTNRRALGRERFLERAWDWSREHGGIILKQLRSLGASCDWDRTVFTMDPAYERAVLHAFVELYRRGYIYRGQRMVNWCPATQTALSDEEVIMKSQAGFLYRVRYEVVERPGEYIEVNTTRPETIPGDTGVAFHPEDPRYQHLLGCHVWRPLVREAIPLVADAAVDREFGSGLLKVTPAHDRVDWEIGQRHGLPVRDVLRPDGILHELAGPELAGLDRESARRRAADLLQESGALVERKPYQNNVGYSERADVPIEPRLTEQWWMRYPKVAEARQAVRDGLIRFWPERWEKTYLHWLDHIQDWCISRQLWWGQRIPVWYRHGVDRATVDFGDPAQVHVSVDGPPDPENWTRDEDVLDTWASSWLWPFATLGWPNQDERTRAELAYFYPTNDLVTGPDIIFFWVARMIMAGLEFMGPERETLTVEEIAARLPFRNVYFTGIIRDAQGRKMSKSLGNSPDPLDLVAAYGADGLRLGVMSMAPKGQDILFSQERVEVGRNFCNKLWNACRFRQMSGPAGDNSSLAAILARIDPARLDEYDAWILERLRETMTSTEQAFATYEFNQLAQQLYAFFWGDFCDWYLEAAKSKLSQEGAREQCLAVQDLVFRQFLLLLHPFCPFITEELWHNLGYGPAEGFLQQTRLEKAADFSAEMAGRGFRPDPAAVERVAALCDLVNRARALKATYNLSARRDVNFFYTADPAQTQALESHLETFKRLAGAAGLTSRDVAPEGAPASLTALGTIYLDLASTVDVAAETKRLTKELETIAKAIAGAEAKLGNEAFTGKAPPNVVQGVRDTLGANREKQIELQRILAGLGRG